MKTIMLGALALVGGVMVLALSVATDGIGGVQAGLTSPSPTSTSAPATQPPRSESTNTPAVTDTATAAATDVPSTSAPTGTPPPAATATPGGGAGGGGVAPPDTGSGPDGASGLGLSWLLAIGAAMAIAGGATVVYGVRRDG
jgi:hypothetical protein